MCMCQCWLCITYVPFQFASKYFLFCSPWLLSNWSHSIHTHTNKHVYVNNYYFSDGKKRCWRSANRWRKRKRSAKCIRGPLWRKIPGRIDSCREQRSHTSNSETCKRESGEQEGKKTLPIPPPFFFIILLLLIRWYMSWLLWFIFLANNIIIYVHVCVETGLLKFWMTFARDQRHLCFWDLFQKLFQAIMRKSQTL
jgi:hypothetical protein